MDWLMLITRLPRARTTAVKVALWRKLKRLGVYTVQDSVYVLPRSERTLELLEWLAAELREAGGEAALWEVKALTEAQEKTMRAFFLDQVNAQYLKIAQDARLASDGDALQRVWGQFHKVKQQDYLRSPLSAEVRAACQQRARELKETAEEEREGA